LNDPNAWPPRPEIAIKLLMLTKALLAESSNVTYSTSQCISFSECRGVKPLKCVSKTKEMTLLCSSSMPRILSKIHSSRTASGSKQLGVFENSNVATFPCWGYGLSASEQTLTIIPFSRFRALSARISTAPRSQVDGKPLNLYVIFLSSPLGAVDNVPWRDVAFAAGLTSVGARGAFNFRRWIRFLTAWANV